MEITRTEGRVRLKIIRLVPNALTLGRVTLAVPVAFALRERDVSSAATLLVLFGLGDLLDGAAARRFACATPIGARLDSAADRAIYVAMLVGICQSGALAGTTTAVLLLILLLQTLLAVWSQRRRLNPSGPKTYMGAPLSALLLLAVATDGVAASMLEVTAVVAAINGLWFYGRGVLGREHHLIEAAAQELACAQSWFLRGYAAKATGTASVSGTVLTVPNLITAARALPGGLALLQLAHGNLVAAGAWGMTFVLLDVVDGALARALGQVSRCGELMDVVLDKSVLLGAIVVAGESGWVPQELVAASGLRLAVIAILSVLIRRQRQVRPRNVWSTPANVGLLVCAAWPSVVPIWAAAALAAQNALHFGHYALRALDHRVR